MSILPGLLRKFRRNDMEMKILLLGIDDSGKSTILHQLQQKQDDAILLGISATVGFQVQSVIYKKFKFAIWELGGLSRFRPFWSNYFDSTDAIIYVIDSSDRRRIEETGVELNRILEHSKLSSVPIFIFANKQDVLTALAPEDISRGLNLHAIRDRQWQLGSGCAITNLGIEEGMDFITNELIYKYKLKPSKEGR